MRAGKFGMATLALAAAIGCSTAFAQVEVRAPGVHVGIGRTPWFNNAALRRELSLQEAQYNRLAKDYNQAWEVYNKNVTELRKDLAEEQRRQRMAEASGTFYGTFDKSVDDVFTEPAARRRYNQLYLQYRGYDAFNDPVVVKKLDLTDEQREAFRRYEAEQEREFREMRREYATNREAATKRYNTWRKQARERIRETLNDRQREAWNEFVGDPYDFQPDVYFAE